MKLSMVIPFVADVTTYDPESFTSPLLSIFLLVDE